MSLKKLSVDGSTRDDASVRSGTSMDDLPGKMRKVFMSQIFKLVLGMCLLHLLMCILHLFFVKLHKVCGYLHVCAYFMDQV